VYVVTNSVIVSSAYLDSSSDLKNSLVSISLLYLREL
jgi:hypothetical protein